MKPTIDANAAGNWQAHSQEASNKCAPLGAG